MIADRVHTVLDNKKLTINYSKYVYYRWEKVISLLYNIHDNSIEIVEDYPIFSDIVLWLPGGVLLKDVGVNRILLSCPENFFGYDFSKYNKYFFGLTGVKNFIYTSPSLLIHKMKELENHGKDRARNS